MLVAVPIDAMVSGWPVPGGPVWVSMESSLGKISSSFLQNFGLEIKTQAVESKTNMPTRARRPEKPGEHEARPVRRARARLHLLLK